MEELKIQLTITKEMIKEAVNKLRETDWKESHNIGMLQPVDNPDEVILYDEMSIIIILVHDEQYPFEEKVFPKNTLKWCGDEMDMHLTLGSISRQLTAIGVKGSIMVIYETGLGGTIYSYGNHGEYWEIVGQLAGWA